MSRFDKYNPVDGGFRAALGFAPAGSDVGKILAVTIDGNGKIQKTGADGTLLRGVICLGHTVGLGDIIDVMTSGEIVDVAAADITNAPAAGALVKAGGAGAVGASQTGIVIGWFVESWRLIVRVGQA